MVLLVSLGVMPAEKKMIRVLRGLVLVFVLAIVSFISVNKCASLLGNVDKRTSEIVSPVQLILSTRKSRLSREEDTDVSTRWRRAFVETNLTSAMITLLENFAKFASSKPPSLADGGKEYLTNIFILEIFTRSIGNNFVLPPNEDRTTNLRQRYISFAVTQSWLLLEHAENVDLILNNVIRQTVTQYMLMTSSAHPLTMSNLQALFQIILEKLENAFEKEDSSLASKMSLARAGFPFGLLLVPYQRAEIYFSFDDLAQEVINYRAIGEWIDNVDIRKFLIHEQFLEMAKKRNSSARSVLKVARILCCRDHRTQQFYTNVLTKAAENFVVADFPEGTIRMFLDDLNRSLEADERLKDLWRTTQEQVRIQSDNVV